MSPVCVLIGPPGSGKSSVGRALAEQLATTFKDTDEVIKDQTGKTIAEIFIEDGEPYFRDLEVQTVANEIAQHEGVLALGGGAVMRSETASALAGQNVVFLDVSLPQATKRVGMSANRPLLLGNVRSKMKTMLDERRPVYESLAKITINTDEKTVAEVASEIATALAAES